MKMTRVLYLIALTTIFLVTLCEVNGQLIIPYLDEDVTSLSEKCTESEGKYSRESQKELERCANVLLTIPLRGNVRLRHFVHNICPQLENSQFAPCYKLLTSSMLTCLSKSERRMSKGLNIFLASYDVICRKHETDLSNLCDLSESGSELCQNDRVNSISYSDYSTCEIMKGFALRICTTHETPCLDNPLHKEVTMKTVELIAKKLGCASRVVENDNDNKSVPLDTKGSRNIKLSVSLNVIQKKIGLTIKRRVKVKVEKKS